MGKRDLCSGTRPRSKAGRRRPGAAGPAALCLANRWQMRKKAVAHNPEFRLLGILIESNVQRWDYAVRLLGDLEIDNSALKTDGHRMSAIVRFQLAEDIRNVTLDSLLSNGQSGANLLIGVPAGNQPKDFDFP
jgi:hypothetical protein